MQTKNTLELFSPSFRKEVLRGFICSFPVLIGFLPFGLLLGAQASQKGMSPLTLGLMTGFNFAGGSEIAAVALWTDIPQVITIVLVSILVNSRYLMMGIAFAPLVYHLPPRKAFPVLFGMCDESWALGLEDATKRRAAGLVPFSGGFYLGLAGSMWFTWVGSTISGAIIGPLFGDISRWGIDIVFPAIFFVLLKGMWKGCRAAIPWVVSLVVAVIVYHFFPGAVYVPAGIVSGILTIILLEKKC